MDERYTCDTTERYLLGCLILPWPDQASRISETVQRVEPAVFADVMFREIYQAIVALYKIEISVNTITLLNQLEEVGGIAPVTAEFLIEIEAARYVPSLYQTYADRLVNLHRKRLLQVELNESLKSLACSDPKTVLETLTGKVAFV